MSSLRVGVSASCPVTAEAVTEKKIKYRKWKRENSKEAWMEYKKCRQRKRNRRNAQLI